MPPVKDTRVGDPDVSDIVSEVREAWLVSVY